MLPKQKVRLLAVELAPQRRRISHIEQTHHISKTFRLACLRCFRKSRVSFAHNQKLDHFPFGGKEIAGCVREKRRHITDLNSLSQYNVDEAIAVIRQFTSKPKRISGLSEPNYRSE